MNLWHNGVFRDDEDAVFTAADRVRLGDGVFDTLLAVDGAPAHANLHFERLIAHANVMEIEIGMGAMELTETAMSLLRENNCGRGRFAVNTVVTRGAGARGLAPPKIPAPSVVMRLSPLPAIFPDIHAVISRKVRRNEGSPLSNIKSLNYGDNILALAEARRRGGNEVLMLNNAGFLACAGAGNLFILKDGQFLTPPLRDGVMDGILRSLLLERRIAREETLTLDDPGKADGIFIGNSLRGLMPVLSLDGKSCACAAAPVDKAFHLG